VLESQAKGERSMRRTKIKDILSRESAGGEVLVQGWVKTKRSSKAVSFIQINDGSTLRDLQVVVNEDSGTSRL
jgi:asparaginyl-tRNA synthetase